MRTSISCCCVTAVLLAAGVHAQGKAWLVLNDPLNPTGDFLQIQPAVDAAAEGDVIVVRSTTTTFTYEAFTIDGKSVTVIGDFQGSLLVFGGTEALPIRCMTVRNLAPDQRVVVRDLRIGTDPIEPGGHVEDCTGPVFLEGVEFLGPWLSDEPALLVEDSPTVVLTDCELIVDPETEVPTLSLIHI